MSRSLNSTLVTLELDGSRLGSGSPNVDGASHVSSCSILGDGATASKQRAAIESSEPVCVHADLLLLSDSSPDDGSESLGMVAIRIGEGLEVGGGDAGLGGGNSEASCWVTWYRVF